MSVARLWKLRQRFGIAAPRVAVRTHVPWYLRWLVLSLLVASSVALGMWMYDAGRRFAGFDATEAEKEISAARSELAVAREELARLRGMSNAAESKLAIERTAQQDLAKQLRSMEAENARLREELAVFESTLSADPKKAAPVSIQRFRVEPELRAGEYRFNLLMLAMGVKRDEFRGRFELIVSLNQGGRDVMMTLPRSAGDDGFNLGFKHFQRIQGTFQVDPAARVSGVQVRVYENGTAEARATQTATLG
jgi:hypothetical protein